MSMIEDRRHGYNQKAEELLEIINENPRGIEHNPLVSQSDYSDKTVEKLVNYLLGKGEIIAEGTRVKRYYPTPNRELDLHENRNKELAKELREAVNEVKEESGKKGDNYRIIVQQVE